MPVADRNKLIDAMVTKLSKSERLVAEFYNDPAKVAKENGLTLTKDEVLGISFVRGMHLASALGRLKGSPVAIFDNNCGCPGPGPSCW